MKTAWRYLLAFGLVGSLTATSCVIKSDPDGTGGSDNDTGGKGSGGSGTGGTATTGGSKATGGMSTGGTGGSSTTGGSKSTGGATATGGATTVIACDNKNVVSKDRADTCEFQPGDLADKVLGPCLTCISKATTCCEQLKDCYSTNPDNQCGWGGLDGESEFLCYRECLVDKAKAAGGAYDPDVDQAVCADACVTPVCKPAPFGDFTSVLVGCMHENCEDECFLDPAM